MDSQAQPNVLPAPARMMQLIAGEFVAKSVTVAAQLDVAGRLASGPARAAELAAALAVDADALYRLLRALASVGVFQEHEDGRFSNTELSSTLRGDVPGSMKAMAMFLCGPALWAAWGELESSVRSGRSGFERVHGGHPFEYMQGHGEFARVFDQAMTGLSQQEVVAIHASFDFSRFGTVVDIAGGHGALLVSCLERNPQQRGILFDRPNVLARARAVVGASSAAGRCELVEGDFFKEVPAGADAYMMKYILHDWSDQEALAILKNIRRAARKGSRLLIMDPIVRPGNVEDFAKFMDLQMLVFYGSGRERTQKDFLDLVEAAGFRWLRTVGTPSAISIIEAEHQG
jgi:ubiquinone/menaquinone biosynthesis C-methylase UbiE